ncbi:uracil nucleotide/cysteinyl leukotriene receptor [Denticeps clupeoides]|nr:uracil nucleotide/cysteinyl leukotriene receptor-like [Denticeps clupeoides]
MIPANYTTEVWNPVYRAYFEKENFLFTLFYVTIFLFSVPANAIALVVFFIQKGKTTVAKVFLTHLVVADMSYVLLLPMRTVYHISNNNWIFGELLCRLAGFLFYLNLYCSLYFMTCISFNRFLAVVFPIRSRSLRKPLYAKMICAFLWCSITISMIPMLQSHQTVHIKSEDFNITVCNQMYREKTSPKALVSTAVAFMIPLAMLTLSYVLILCKLFRMNLQGNNGIQRKAVYVITLTLMNFLLAFVPYHVHRFIYILRYIQGDVPRGTMELLVLWNRITSALTCTSGIIDPIMYFFLAKTYRETLLHILRRLREKCSTIKAEPA